MWTNRKRVFIAEYLRDFNASRAARVAGYSAKTAYSKGPQLLKDIEISAVIKATLAEKQMSADEVLSRLTDIARGDMGDLMDVSTMGFSIELMKDGQRKSKTKLIKKLHQRVTTTTGKNSKDETEIIDTDIELYSALDALALIGKYHRLFVDKTELSLPQGINLVWDYPKPPETSD